MNIELVLNTLEKVADQMKKANDFDRLNLYTSFKFIVSELAEYVEDPQNEYMSCNDNLRKSCHAYFGEMDSPLKCLAGLEKKGLDDSQQVIWIKQVIRKLRSIHCFNIA